MGVISSREFSAFEMSALQISPDIGDVPYLALAMKLDAALWSNDSALKGQKMVKVITTAELFQLKPARGSL